LIIGTATLGATNFRVNGIPPVSAPTRRCGPRNIYTPEFVLNGREWRDWYGSHGVPDASALKTAALLVRETSSDVRGGENAGRHLNHDFAALSLITQPLPSQTKGLQGKFIIDAAPKGITGRFALAVWVTRHGQLEPLQATGGWLPMAGKMNLSVNQPTQTEK
jgi:hypothetical protein